MCGSNIFEYFLFYIISIFNGFIFLGGFSNLFKIEKFSNFVNEIIFSYENVFFYGSIIFIFVFFLLCLSNNIIREGFHFLFL